MWQYVRRHSFRRRATIQYPEEKPTHPAALARAHRAHPRPRRRGALRGLLPVRGGLPGGLHRAAGDRGRARPALSGVLPHQLLALHLLRLLRGGLPDLRDPAHAGLRDGRVRAPESGLREGGPADRRTGQVSRTTISTASRGSPSAARTRARPRTSARRSTCATCCRERRTLHANRILWWPRQWRSPATLLAVTRLDAVHALLYLIVSLLAVAVVSIRWARRSPRRWR